METPRSNAYYDYNERPLPTHRKGQESRLGEVTEVDEEPTRDSESGFFRGIYDFCFIYTGFVIIQAAASFALIKPFV